MCYCFQLLLPWTEDWALSPMIHHPGIDHSILVNTSLDSDRGWWNSLEMFGARREFWSSYQRESFFLLIEDVKVILILHKFNFSLICLSLTVILYVLNLVHCCDHYHIYWGEGPGFLLCVEFQNMIVLLLYTSAKTLSAFVPL